MPQKVNLTSEILIKETKKINKKQNTYQLWKQKMRVCGNIFLNEHNIVNNKVFLLLIVHDIIILKSNMIMTKDTQITFSISQLT